jgi:hypothetical protein
VYFRKIEPEDWRWMEHIQCWALVLADHILPPWKKLSGSPLWCSFLEHTCMTDHQRQIKFNVILFKMIRSGTGPERVEKDLLK